MRIAVTGTHGSGKTTLIEDLVESLASYQSVPEPYWLLAQDGTPFADGPNTADLEEQLGRSCTLLLDQVTEDSVVFDRCPLDFIAYLDVVSASEGHEWLPQGRLLHRVGKALATLDLIVFVPLRQPDEIRVSIEFPQLRSRVDRRLKAMLRQDDLGLLGHDTRILEVSGTREHRVTQIVAAIDGA
jgi:GTPase SAR1 family protein